MLVCAKCNRALRPKKNGVEFVEMAGKENRPYKLWMADLWECQDCGTQILHTDSRQSPIAVSGQDNFEQQLSRYAPIYHAKEWMRKPTSEGEAVLDAIEGLARIVHATPYDVFESIYGRYTPEVTPTKPFSVWMPEEKTEYLKQHPEAARNQIDNHFYEEELKRFFAWITERAR